MGGSAEGGKRGAIWVGSLSVTGQAPNHNSYDKSAKTRHKRMSQRETNDVGLSLYRYTLYMWLIALLN